MTVSELIEALRQFPPDMRVVASDTEYDEYLNIEVNPVEIKTQEPFAILSLDGVEVAPRPPVKIEKCLAIELTGDN